jgi:DNA-directed RNA polymerase specialized sigma24 family protein
LRFRYEESLSVPEIGKRLRTTTAAVAMTLSRVRAALLRCVGTLEPQEAR